MEGVVAKRLDSPYMPGVRTEHWRKIKNVRRQEAVVAGYKPGQGNRTGQVGSLLIGVHDESGLIYAGHVGTGFTVETLRMLGDKLRPLRRADSPFDGPVPARACPPGRLGRAPAGDRRDLRPVDPGGPDARPGVQRPARRHRPRDVIAGETMSPEQGRRPGGRPDADADQPGQGAVPGHRVHQGRGAGLLPADRAGAAPAHRGPADDPQALPGGRRRPGLLPEARHRAPAGLDSHRRGGARPVPGPRPRHPGDLPGDRRPARADLGGQPGRP